MEEALKDHLCIHGRWEDGICTCEVGYDTGFVDLTLRPQYCGNEAVVLIKNTNYDPENLIHLATMAMTVVFTTCSCIAMVSFLCSIWNLQRLRGKTKESRQAVMMFEAQQIRRDIHDNLHAEIWTPPLVFHCVTGECDDGLEPSSKKAFQAKVLHQYKPQDKHELKLTPGDIITEVEKLDQGWCKGKLYGKLGFFPEAFVELVSV